MDSTNYPVSCFPRTILIGLSHGIRMRFSNLGDGQYIEEFNSLGELRTALESLLADELNKALSYVEPDEEE